MSSRPNDITVVGYLVGHVEQLIDWFLLFVGCLYLVVGITMDTWFVSLEMSIIIYAFALAVETFS
tara:strand:- start:681 stop:875 length:195 start_codon:yes stop_codon:yes gene_type:complete